MEMPWDLSPPEMAHVVHRIIRKETGVSDPYRGVKRESNTLALEFYPEAKKKVESSDDPLLTALKISVAGNIMDFGAMESFNLEETVEKVLESEFRIDHSSRLISEIKGTRSMAVVLDNAGEIVFDRLLVETAKQANPSLEKVLWVVKGGPILNDAMMEDAKAAGLDRIEGVESSFFEVSNGDPATGPERSSPEFVQELKKWGVVISKGQGNYEAMSEYPGIYFVLMAKCPVVADDIGVEVGDLVVWKSGEREG